MPSDDDFQKLEGEFLALARRIFDAGVKTERERVVSLIQGGDTMGVDAGVRPRRRAGAAEYGAVSGPVRDALIAMAAESPEGVGAGEIAEYFTKLGGGPDLRQIRAALKTLSLSAEATRVSRGRYLPRLSASEPGREEKPGDDSPDSVDLAAE
jgi:hypothetical protein